MSAVQEGSKIVLRSPSAFAAAVPALLGFSPIRSLVAVYLSGGHVIVTMRLDLPEPLDECAEYVANTGSRLRADEVILAVYCPTADHERLRPGLESVVSVIGDAGIAVRDVLLIDGGRYWSFLCRDQQCCPPEGNPIPADTTVLEAERIGSGHPAVAESREEVVARYQPRPDLIPPRSARKQARQILTVPVAERAQQVWDEVKILAARPQIQDDTTDLMRARIQVAMGDVRVRDFVLAHIAVSETAVDARVDVIVQAALTAPEYLRPPIAAAAAALLVSCGTSSIATTCLLDLAEGQSLADLVRISVQAAVPPDTLRETFGQALPMVVAQLRAASKETSATA